MTRDIAALLALGQGAYYLATGVWALVSIRSFEAVTGPKTDRWLVKTVGVLVSVIGLALALAGWRRRVEPESAILAAGSAAGLAAIDTVYAAKGRIAKIYLLDALVEVALVAAWAAAARRRAAPLLLILVAGGLVGCRSGAPITWGTVPPPTVRADVVDARGRFREIFCAVRAVRAREAPVPDDRPCAAALVRLPDEPPATGAPVATTPSSTRRRIVVVPGIFGECLAPWITPFADSLPRLEALGYRTELIRVSGTAASAANAQRVRDFVLALADLAPDERVVVVAYSKGAVDVLEALAAFPELVPRVAALVSVAGPIAGSPIADGFAPWERAIIEALAAPFCGGGRGGITSLTREERRAFLARVRLPSVRYFSVVGMVEETEVSRGLLPPYRDLAVVDPHNDGQVVAEDAVIPGGVLLGYVRGDHWAIAVPVSRKTGPLGWLARWVIDRNPYPREVLLEAIVRAVEERL